MEDCSMGSFRHIRTYCGTTLLARRADGVVVNGYRETKELASTIAYTPSHESLSCYLFTELGAAVHASIPPLEPIGRIVPLRIARGPTDTTVAFYSPWTRLFLVTAQPGQDADWAPVALAATQVGPIERYTLRDAGAIVIDDYVSQSIAQLARLHSLADPVGAILTFIEEAAPDAVAADALTAATLLLTAPQMRELARRLDVRPAAISRLTRFYPLDIAATVALPLLSTWKQSRVVDTKRLSRDPMTDADRTRESGPQDDRSIGPQFDHLDRTGLGGSFVSVPHSINLSLRQLIHPHRRACIVATARNEGVYLVDWIAHHRAMGFEAIFIYTNDNTDESDGLLRALADAGEITWVRNDVSPGTRPQWKAYNHALRVLPEILDYEWALFVDLDEYFALDTTMFRSVDDYLNWQERQTVDAIALNWAMIGPNAETHWRDEPLPDRFPTSNRIADKHIKSLFRPGVFQAAMPHFPVQFRSQSVVFRNAIGDIHQYDSGFGPARSLKPLLSYAWIDHFFYKSNEEFILKFARGRGTDRSGVEIEGKALTTEFISNFIALTNQTPFDADPERPMKQEVARHRQRIMTDSRTQLAHDMAVDAFKGRSRQVIGRAVLYPGIRQSGDLGEALLRPLLGRPDAPDESPIL